MAGPAFADLLTAHKWAARMIVRAIDRKLGGLPSDAARQSWMAPFSAA